MVSVTPRADRAVPFMDPMRSCEGYFRGLYFKGGIIMSRIGPAGLQSFREVLEKALSTPPSIDYPIKLTPHSPYEMGRATLIFFGPHVLNPAENFAEYGWETIEEAYGSLVHNTPHEGACVTAWF